jgi:outer membrane cobalamin receptor
VYQGSRLFSEVVSMNGALRRRGDGTPPPFPFLVAVLASLLGAGCATAPVQDAREPNEREGPIITREDIERTAARTGWDALRLSGTTLNIQFTREGSRPRVTHRGVDSFYINSEVLLVVDGTHMQSIMELQDIPAASIEYIQVLPARVGVVKYGTNAGNGVVVVSTHPPPSKR